MDGHSQATEHMVSKVQTHTKFFFFKKKGQTLI